MRPLRASKTGLLTTQELRDRKFSRKQIESMLRWAWLIRLHRGVYFVTPPDVLARAALVVAGEGSTLCLESALGHLYLRLRPPGPVHVNLALNAKPDREQRIKFHRARIPESDITTVRGLRTTTPTRTLLDVAPKQPRYALFRALEQAERLQLHVDRTRLDAHAHLTQPLELFDHYGPCTRSDAEAMFLFICEDHGIARPRVNEPLHGREPDFHWPEHNLVVEVDGYEFHEGLPAFRDDRRRGNRFNRGGYEVIRFAASDVEHEPAEVAETLLAARPGLRSRASAPRRASR